MTMILMEQSVSCILHIYQPIYKKKIHINSLDIYKIFISQSIKIDKNFLARSVTKVLIPLLRMHQSHSSDHCMSINRATNELLDIIKNTKLIDKLVKNE